MMHTIVVKFGGTSLASAAQIQKAAAIIRANPERRFVVASAPGKRASDDTKVTDLLYRCYDKAAGGEDFEPVLAAIGARFGEIAEGLGVRFDVGAELAAIRAHLQSGPQRDYMASRGEYLNSKLLAAYLGFAFVDAAAYVRFDAAGVFLPEQTNAALHDALDGLEYAVVPGFYGAKPDGSIHTFSRGGSDVTGSLVARAVGAALYENWTDVSGMLSADPRIVPHPHPISRIDYQQLRELSYLGASVLHEDAVFPVRKAGIPIQIRNTNEPEAAGTMIVPTLAAQDTNTRVTGVAARSGFSAICLEKALPGGRSDFLAALLALLARHGLSVEHCPVSVDAVSVLVRTDALEACREAVLADIRAALSPEDCSVVDGMALLGVAGAGLTRNGGVLSRILGALDGMPVCMSALAVNGRSLVLAVPEAQKALALRSVYTAVEPLM